MPRSFAALRTKTYLFPLSLFLGLSELLLPLHTKTLVTIRVWHEWHPGEEVDQSVVTEVLTHLSKSQEVPESHT